MVSETFSVRVYQKGGRDFSPHPKPPVISPITTTHKVVGSDPLPIMSGLGVASRSFNSEGPNAFAGGGPQRAARGAWRARRAACGAWRARQGRRFWCFSVRPCRGGVGSRNFHGFMWVGNLHDRAPQLVRACSMHYSWIRSVMVYVIKKGDKCGKTRICVFLRYFTLILTGYTQKLELSGQDRNQQPPHRYIFG